MKKLTLNRVAGAGVRANLREYLGLSAGILATIFLTCTVYRIRFLIVRLICHKYP